MQPHRWFSGQRVHLECGRSWIRVWVKQKTILICRFSAKNASPMSKSKDKWAQNQDHVIE